MGLTTRAKRFLLATFLFFYAPVAYYLGFNLTPGILLDFPSYYYAAQLAFSPTGSPYGFRRFDAASALLGRKIHPFLYPPYSLIAFWPFVPLTLQQAQTAFLVVSHLCFLGSLWLLVFKLTPPQESSAVRELVAGAVLVYVLFFDPVLSTFGGGQINLVVLLFLFCAFAALKRNGSPWLVGLPLSLAILLKTYPVLLLPLLVVRRQFRAALVTIASLACFTLLAVACLRTEVWNDWFTLILPHGGYGNNDIAAAFVWNQSLNGFITRLLTPSIFAVSPLSYSSLAGPITTSLAALVLVVTLSLSLLVSRRAAYPNYHDDELSAFLLMIFLIAPLSWDHHLVYLLPALAIVISRLITQSVKGSLACSLLLCLFLLAWRIPLDHPALHVGWLTLVSSLKFYPVVVLWLYFVYSMARPLISARVGG